MSKLKIYHNPRCQKSRQTLELIRSKGQEPEIVEYLKDVPDKKEMELILAKLNLKPTDILRTKEQLFKEKFKGKKFTDAEWIEVMIEYPVLIERPIVIKDNKAVIGRPPENVLEFFKG
jgi:arsenate reductase (glutaredoxin)